MERREHLFVSLMMNIYKNLDCSFSHLIFLSVKYSGVFTEYVHNNRDGRARQRACRAGKGGPTRHNNWVNDFMTIHKLR